MGKVLCFGELLLRMSPALNRQWIHSASIPVYIGGAELNAAHALAKWKIPTAYFTAAPDHYLTHEILEELQSKNIDTSRVHFSGSRIGTYYLPQGVDLKNAGVIYDRAHSSFAELSPGIINWKKILKDISWLHFSAICPAVSATAAQVCEELLATAREMNITISIDLNYRARLWQYGKSPIDVMPALTKYCSVIMGNLWAVDTMLGVAGAMQDSEAKTKEELVDAAKRSMESVRLQYPLADTIAYTFRMQKTYFAVLWQQGQISVSKEHILGEIKDKVGSGDCFMAGLIYGLYLNRPAGEIVDFAATAAVNKLYEVGDATRRSVEEIQSLINKQVN